MIAMQKFNPSSKYFTLKNLQEMLESGMVSIPILRGQEQIGLYGVYVSDIANNIIAEMSEDDVMIISYARLKPILPICSGDYHTSSNLVIKNLITLPPGDLSVKSDYSRHLESVLSFLFMDNGLRTVEVPTLSGPKIFTNPYSGER